jgi:nucleoside-diphosphate-sugar epimerase
MILIAGGRGFIGSNLAKVFDGLDPNLYEIADLKDGVDVCDIDGSKYEVIVLLAANLGQDMQMFQDNLRICKWAMRQPAHIIFTSSAAVYSANAAAHIENEETLPYTLYGKSKQIGEQLIVKGSKSWTILRLANVYGNGEGNGVIDIFKRGGRTIYGDGEDVRDYVSVNTVCEAIKTIALNPEPYNKEIYNISSFVPVTTKEAFDQYGSGEPIFAPKRGFDVEYSLLWNAKAKEAGLINDN